MKKTASLIFFLILSYRSEAQASLDPADIGKPPVGNWTTYHGDYSGRHYSTLSAINQGNVGKLTLAWVYKFNVSAQGAQRGGAVKEAVPISLGPGALAGGMVKATPLEVNGVLYLSAPDHAWAVDARSGREIWHYFWRTSGGEYIGNRGMAMVGGNVYFGTPDGHLVALDAASGEERWHKQVGPVEQNYFVSTAPVAVGNHLILGPSGDVMNVPAWVEARNPESGEVQWKWSTTPAANTPDASTWPSEESLKTGGGMSWQPVTYDPDLNLIYVGTGNPDPSYAPEARRGDNLYTCSLVALDADTGKMRWYFQSSPNEAWDFDSNQVPVLFDAIIKGKIRHVVAQITRNGFYFLLDRATGEHLLTSQVAESVNWSEGVNEKGQPVRRPEKIGQLGGALVSPSNGGIQNWTPPAYLPETGSIFFNAMQGFDLHYTYGTPSENGARDHYAQAVGGYDLSLRALDTLSGKLRWVHRYAGSEWNPPRPHLVGGLLSTAGNLIFSGAPAGGPGGFMVAYDPRGGRQLWHATLPAPVSNTPITYMLDGQQYLVFVANDLLFAYVLQTH